MGSEKFVASICLEKLAPENRRSALESTEVVEAVFSFASSASYISSTSSS